MYYLLYIYIIYIYIPYIYVYIYIYACTNICSYMYRGYPMPVGDDDDEL